MASVADGMRSVCGDIRDLPALQAAMLEARPEVVFHLAAQPLVRASYDDPIGTYATNVMGTLHVLQAARQAAIDLRLTPEHRTGWSAVPRELQPFVHDVAAPLLAGGAVFTTL